VDVNEETTGGGQLYPPEYLTIDQLLVHFPEDCKRFVVRKWRLDRWRWTSGNPPGCPGDILALAERLETTGQDAANEDAKWVAELAQEMQVDGRLRQHLPFGEIPIDNAQAWWNTHYEESYNCHGELL
jgi:hypothetical protein